MYVKHLEDPANVQWSTKRLHNLQNDYEQVSPDSKFDILCDAYQVSKQVDTTELPNDLQSFAREALEAGPDCEHPIR